MSFLLWLTLLQTSLAVNVPGPNGTVVTQILSATSSNPEVKVVEDRDLGKILVYPPQPKEFTVKIIAKIMYPDDQYLEKISTVMVGGAGVTIESSEIRNSLILATLKVAPGASGGRFSITYENEDNANHKGCNVRLLPVELAIHNGQGAVQPVPENKEETVGAFTVANLKDTDGDGVKDNGDNTVKKAANAEAGVEDEVDLMKLVVKEPNMGRMKVTVVSGQVKFWEKSTKETEKAKQGNAIFIDDADLPKILWVEATNHSAAVRDIELKLGWEDENQKLTDDLDTVKATAVWTEKTGFVHQQGQAIPADFDDPISQPWKANPPLLLLGPFFTQQGPRGGMIMEFEVKPAGIEQEAAVKFDLARKVAFTTFKWVQQNGKFVQQLIRKEGFSLGDEANDDADPGDEDVIPKNRHIYDTDVPQVNLQAGALKPLPQEILQDMANFNEWMRVKFDAVRPSNASIGSRCSDQEKWHYQSKSGFTPRQGGGRNWVFDPNFQSRVNTGHVQLP